MGRMISDTPGSYRDPMRTVAPAPASPTAAAVTTIRPRGRAHRAPPPGVADLQVKDNEAGAITEGAARDRDSGQAAAVQERTWLPAPAALMTTSSTAWSALAANVAVVTSAGSGIVPAAARPVIVEFDRRETAFAVRRAG